MDPAPFDLLGRLFSLWLQSPLQRDWDLDAAARFLLPPVGLGQFELIERDGAPAAYCSWALLDEAAEQRYLQNPSELPLAAWHSGARLWIVDWVAPFSAHDSWALRRRLLCRFPGREAKALRIHRDGARAHLVRAHSPPGML